MLWQPLNLTAQCPLNTHLTVCSSFGYIYLNLLIQLYGDSEDRRIQEKLRELHLDNDVIGNINGYERELNDGKVEQEEYDFIVVGAGSAGCVVANRLTEIEGWKVLLLEAGPEQPDISLGPALSTAMKGSNVDWNYETEPDGRSCLARTNGRCSWPRGRMMGGSSSINTFVYIKGNPLDYDNWAAMGNEGWSYDEVQKYFKKSEKNLNIEGLNRKYHGVHGPQPVSRFPFIDQPSILLTEAFNQIGLPLVDFGGPEQIGTMQTQAFQEGGVRVSTNNAFIQPIRYKRKNLVVKPNSEVMKILIRHKKAYGVKYVRNGRTNTAFARKEVIVASGAVNSPKLLLLSGIGPKRHLQDLNIPLIQDLAVGENMQDHSTFTGIVIAFSNNTATTVSKQEMLEQVIDYKEAKIKRGPMSSSGPFNSLAFFKSAPDLSAPDVQIQTISINSWREYIREPVEYEDLNILPSVFYDAVIPRVQNIVPKSRGRLLLNKTNPYGPPLLYANYFKDPRDIIPIKRGVQVLLYLEKTRPFRENKARFIKVPLPACKHTIWGTDEYTECMSRHYTLALSHQAGTCKMGPKEDKKAVVDTRLRVHGISGLRVIDASIMPVVIRGNTNAPAIMIGEKGADLIKEDWLNKLMT